MEYLSKVLCDYQDATGDKARGEEVRSQEKERKGTSKVPARYRVLPYPNPEGASTRQDERYRDTEIRILLSVLFYHD